MQDPGSCSRHHGTSCVPLKRVHRKSCTAGRDHQPGAWVRHVAPVHAAVDPFERPASHGGAVQRAPLCVGAGGAAGTSLCAARRRCDVCAEANFCAASAVQILEPLPKDAGGAVESKGAEGTAADEAKAAAEAAKDAAAAASSAADDESKAAGPVFKIPAGYRNTGRKCPPAIYAARCGLLEACHFLLRKGANMYQTDDDGANVFGECMSVPAMQPLLTILRKSVQAPTTPLPPRLSTPGR